MVEATPCEIFTFDWYVVGGFYFYFYRLLLLFLHFVPL